MSFEYLNGESVMKNMKTLCATVALSLVAGTAVAQSGSGSKLVQFEGGIGSQPFASVGGAPGPNDVNGIAPGGRPWFIRKLKATIYSDGRIAVRGRGLILGGGASTGTRGGVTQVAATLFCGGIAFDSPAVPIAVNGDFEIRDALNAVPPAPCTGPILLIRNASGGVPGAWFAAGLLEGDDD
jgi:hypothetical protein